MRDVKFRLASRSMAPRTDRCWLRIVRWASASDREPSGQTDPTVHAATMVSIARLTIVQLPVAISIQNRLRSTPQ